MHACPPHSPNIGEYGTISRDWINLPATGKCFSSAQSRLERKTIGLQFRKGSCSEKRKYAVDFLLFSLYILWIVRWCMRWKFSLVCALALYMLNQSKLYLDRHICLSICLWFYRNNHFCGKYKFQWRCKAETTHSPSFFFWLQRFMDEPSNDILRMRGR